MKYSRPHSARGIRLNWRLPRDVVDQQPPLFVSYGELEDWPQTPLGATEWFDDLSEAEAVFEQVTEDGLDAFLGECGVGEIDGLKNPVADFWVFRWNCFFDASVEQERYYGYPASVPKKRYEYEPLNFAAHNTFHFSAEGDPVSPTSDRPDYDDDDVVRRARDSDGAAWVVPGPDQLDHEEEEN